MRRTRVDELNQMCTRLGKHRYTFQDRQKIRFKHIVVDDKNKAMFCYVPKVACTHLLRIFLSLSDNINVSNPLHLEGKDVHILKRKLTYLDTYSNPEIEYRINHYKNVIFVREPLERVFSAFRSKFVLTHDPRFINYYGRKIKNRSRNVSSKMSTDKHGVNFTDFVQYLLHWRTIEEGYNEHWDSYCNLCHPCLVKYNFIGKYESFEKDVAALLKLLSIEGRVQFQKREENYMHVPSADMMSTYFKMIPQELFEDLIQIYTEDYLLFDYEIPSIEQVLKRHMSF
ncbi:carbohydrate sulfotransferase 11-like [Mercenaria mercenaria]|uniref:carbohydrate sulfotransferase 11-like n=1 Tax=Mercenaria mercenaria TaxID=6596 RepID=UPI00234FB311|nr:carbohydrate sulfotransferase 11-like [Mercenaria mercenaria]